MANTIITITTMTTMTRNIIITIIEPQAGWRHLGFPLSAWRLRVPARQAESGRPAACVGRESERVEQ
jgi:hypothetical protein